jgi:sensor histidine kinase YesM
MFCVVWFIYVWHIDERNLLILQDYLYIFIIFYVFPFKFVCIFVRDIFVTFVLFLLFLTTFLNLFPVFPFLLPLLHM